jgi:hypothetical protein
MVGYDFHVQRNKGFRVGETVKFYGEEVDIVVLQGINSAVIRREDDNGWISSGLDKYLGITNGAYWNVSLNNLEKIVSSIPNICDDCIYDCINYNENFKECPFREIKK